MLKMATESVCRLGGRIELLRNDGFTPNGM